jgi:tetratricopeptide (TPR) repeat protein
LLAFPSMTSYAGSVALAPEAREKVLQTFRHTLSLAQSGKVEEALLGCDFILKLDGRFAPARALLDALRTAAPGAPVDVSRFLEFLAHGGAEELPSSAEIPDSPTPAPALRDAFPAASPAAPSAAGMDDLVFGEAGTPPGSALAPPTPAAPAPAVPAPSLIAPVPGGDPFGGLDLSLGSGLHPGPGAPLPAPAPGPAAPSAAPSRPLSGVQNDPRIAQFLKQGDEAFARGSVQDAIDLWSRVFLIDLSNEEASRRIDQARETQAEAARKIDILLSEGVQSYEAGDLAGARNKFLDVLALSENDATARGYLNQIDAALSTPGATGGPPATAPTPDSDFMRNEIEAPQPPSFAQEIPALEPAAPAGESPSGASLPKRGGAVDLRILLAGGVLLLAAIGGGTYWYLRRARPAAPGASSAAATKPGAPHTADDPFQKAQALFEAGKVDEAIAVLLKLPDSDPRHNEALVRIEKMKSSAAPMPTAAAPSEAALDEMRVAGLTAMSSSRYIDAVRNLDPVVKSRPQDAEAAAALKKALDQVAALSSAVKSYNEGDYESAIKLLWEARKQDPRNQDVEEYLANAYVNSAVQALQAGNMAKAQSALKEATELKPNDTEAQRLLRFVRKYPRGATDLLSRILIKHLSVRP